MKKYAIVNVKTLKIVHTFYGEQNFSGKWKNKNKFKIVPYPTETTNVTQDVVDLSGNVTSENFTRPQILKPTTVEAVVIDNEIVVQESTAQVTNQLNTDWELLRQKRNKLLTDTDWVETKYMELSDTDYDNWLTYRKNLRDLPANTADPTNVTWPTRPSGDPTNFNTDTNRTFYNRSKSGEVAARFYRPDTTPKSNPIVEFASGGSESVVAHVRLDGKIVANGVVLRSDQTIKENIVDARTDYMTDLNQLQVRNFNFIGTDPVADKQLGFIAQEIQTVFPGIVTDVLTPNGSTVLGIKGNVLIPLLVAGLQETHALVKANETELANKQTLIDALTTQNTNQQTQIDDLLTRVTALEAV